MQVLYAINSIHLSVPVPVREFHPLISSDQPLLNPVIDSNRLFPNSTRQRLARVRKRHQPRNSHSSFQSLFTSLG